jgi:hypothetical protein
MLSPLQPTLVLSPCTRHPSNPPPGFSELSQQQDRAGCNIIPILQMRTLRPTQGVKPGLVADAGFEPGPQIQSPEKLWKGLRAVVFRSHSAPSLSPILHVALGRRQGQGVSSTLGEKGLCLVHLWALECNS